MLLFKTVSYIQRMRQCIMFFRLEKYVYLQALANLRAEIYVLNSVYAVVHVCLYIYSAVVSILLISVRGWLPYCFPLSIQCWLTSKGIHGRRVYKPFFKIDFTLKVKLTETQFVWSSFLNTSKILLIRSRENYDSQSDFEYRYS